MSSSLPWTTLVPVEIAGPGEASGTEDLDG
jgi:hypothetical protein